MIRVLGLSLEVPRGDTGDFSKIQNHRGRYRDAEGDGGNRLLTAYPFNYNNTNKGGAIWATYPKRTFRNFTPA